MSVLGPMYTHLFNFSIQPTTSGVCAYVYVCVRASKCVDVCQSVCIKVNVCGCVYTHIHFYRVVVDCMCVRLRLRIIVIASVERAVYSVGRYDDHFDTYFFLRRAGGLLLQDHFDVDNGYVPRSHQYV